MAVAHSHDLSLPALATRIDDPAQRRARVRQLAATLAPVSLSNERTLPVVPALAELLPAGGLARGSLVSVGGSCGAVSLALVLTVEAARAGSWVVAVGLDELNWEAALALGVPAERVVVVRVGERSAATEVMAAVVDAADVVLVGGDVVLAASAVRRLRARARERGSVLVRVQPHYVRAVGAGRRHGATGDDRWDGAELSLHAQAVGWPGLGQGWGHLNGRLLEVAVGGRRGSMGGGQGLLWLPDDQGRVRPPEPDELSRVGVGRVEAGPAGGERLTRLGGHRATGLAGGRSVGPVVPLRPTGTGGR
ncbi:MAG: hypothetical protein R2754_07805 [Microthrixaceae bacterium]